MAGSVLGLGKIADGLQHEGVALKVLDQSIDTSTSDGMLNALHAANRMTTAKSRSKAINVQCARGFIISTDARENFTWHGCW
jgi:hypothetical protein